MTPTLRTATAGIDPIELAVIGPIIREPLESKEALRAIMGLGFDAQHFRSASCRHLWTFILELNARNELTQERLLSFIQRSDYFGPETMDKTMWPVEAGAFGLCADMVSHSRDLMERSQEGGVSRWHTALQTFPDLVEHYEFSLARSEACQLDLSRWLPSFGHYIRPLVPGELVVFVADTGIGKTAILQNVCYSAAPPLKTLFFEIELPADLMCERFFSLHTQQSGRVIEAAFRGGSPTKHNGEFDHLTFCSLSNVSVGDIQEIVQHYNATREEPAAIVVIDYIGLLKGRGSRYERMSDNAEALKVLAKTTNTIVVTSSQVRREGNDGTKEVGLHDAKDSGSIENSAGLVLGAWREGDGGEKMKIKILKSTKGGGGSVINAHFHGASLRIVEESNRTEPRRPYAE